MPAEMMPTRLLSIRPIDPAETLAKRLRAGTLQFSPEIHQESVLLDFRTIQPDEDPLVESALTSLLARTTAE